MNTDATATNSPQSPSQPTVNTEGMSDAEFVQHFEGLVANILSMRREMLGHALDPRRDLDDECGYPKLITAEQYQKMYERDPIAKRVCEAMVKECYQVPFEVYETEDVEQSTPFEEDWEQLSRRQLRSEPSWFKDEEGFTVVSYLKRASILARIGHYSVILFGLDDGMDLREPVKGVVEYNSAPTVFTEVQEGDKTVTKVHATPVEGIYGLTVNLADPMASGGEGGATGEGKPTRELLYLRVFPEAMAKVTHIEANPTSPRFGQPVRYSITFNDPREEVDLIGVNAKSMDVHWTRIVHVVGQLTTSEVFSPPKMQTPFNRLMDLQKLYGGSAEMFWKGAFFGLAFESNPQLGPNPVLDRAGTKAELEKYFNGLQRYLQIVGMTVKVLAPQVADPTNHINVQLEAIAIGEGMPMRILKGSERGELASSQDDDAWNDRVKSEQKLQETPYTIVPFVNRCIMLGLVRPPKEYSIAWPDITSQSAVEKANVAYTYTQSLALFVTSGAEAAMTLQDYYVRVWKMTEEEAEMIVEQASEAQLEGQEADDERELELIEKGLKPDPTEPAFPARPNFRGGV